MDDDFDDSEDQLIYEILDTNLQMLNEFIVNFPLQLNKATMQKIIRTTFNSVNYDPNDGAYPETYGADDEDDYGMEIEDDDDGNFSKNW
jgi:hypothetical protein